MVETDPVEQLIQETRAFVATRPAPDFVAAVMHQVEQLDANTVNTSEGWITRVARTLWTPRSVTFELRPAYGLFAAVALLVLTAALPRGWPTGDHPAAIAGTQHVEPKVYVQFRLQTSGATDVRLAGSFTQWQPQYQLHETTSGLWTVTLPLAPGVHDYAFIVDGRWMTDPYAPAIQDGFGGANSRITLVAGSDRHL
jgi:hypothetical protein